MLRRDDFWLRLSGELLQMYEGFPAPAETIRRATALLRESLQAEAISILLYDLAQDALVFEVVEGGAGASLVGRAVPKGKGLAWWAFENDFVKISDCAADERFFGEVDEETGFSTRNMIALPFGSQGRVIGVIQLVNMPAECIEHAHVDAVMKIMAGHIGTAYAASNLRHRMAGQKKALEEEKSELEDKVRERTRELTEALENIKAQNELLQRTENQLFQSEKLAGLGQLAAGVAHEINNPIGFIASNLNTSREYWESFCRYTERMAEANPEVAEVYRGKYDIEFIEEDMTRLIDECLEGTSRVTNIVRSLKEFAHQGRGDATETAVHGLIDRTLSIALSPFKHRVRVERDYQGSPLIHCEGQELGQVVLNLAVNAAQAIEEQGVITLRTFDEDDSFVLEVEDTGAGIPEENLNRIFEPFFTTKDVGEGTGLGLSTCFHLMKKAGGDLQVRSEVGRGTTFRLTLPLRRPEPADAGADVDVGARAAS
jgi:signal transduction histidine kinase